MIWKTNNKLMLQNGCYKSNKEWIFLFGSMKVTVYILPTLNLLWLFPFATKAALNLLTSMAVPPHPAQVCQGEYNMHLLKWRIKNKFNLKSRCTRIGQEKWAVAAVYHQSRSSLVHTGATDDSFCQSQLFWNILECSSSCWRNLYKPFQNSRTRCSAFYNYRR